MGICPYFLPTPFVVDAFRRLSLDCGEGKPREISHADRGTPGNAGATCTATAEQVLGEIREYCRATRTAESTFGRLVVNDGKLVSRLRDGAQDHHRHPRQGARLSVRAPAARRRRARKASRAGEGDQRRRGRHRRRAAGFRFFDNRQKYLLFVSTCSEKTEVASRISLELGNLQPAPPALRIFDAGVGDGTVLSRVMRAVHARFPTMPLYVVAKEISYEDVRLMLEKMADRLFEHPATVLVVTNLYYAEAPWLTPRSATAAQSLIWKDVALSGNTAHGFAEQIGELEGFLAENWRAGISPTTGNPVYQRPIVLTLRREDHSFLLDPIMPRPGTGDGGLRSGDCLAALSGAGERRVQGLESGGAAGASLRAGGRLIGIHSHGGDPGMEIIDGVWPGDNPFTSDRHAILRQVKHELGSAARHYNFNVSSDARSIFRYHMHTLPDEVSGPIGTSTLFAAWNAAIYVAQIEDVRLSEVVRDGRYLEATDRVLKKHGGLWFNDETYVISRRRAQA